VQVEARHAAKVDIEHEARWLAVDRRAQILVRAGVRLDGDPCRPQDARERGAHGRVVVDNGDPSILFGRGVLDGLHGAMT
jgi:hypothetical protein